MAWFADLDLPTGIEDLPQPGHIHHFRLGQHFEQLLFRWILACRNIQLLESNLQVFDQKRTVGEFDLLVNFCGQVEHWEVAVKFYLGVGQTHDPGCWYGPNTSDRLDIKLNRLIDHQLQLSTNTFGRETLGRLGIEISNVRCFMKGRLFYPWHQFQANKFESAPTFSPNHERGWWIEETLAPAANIRNAVYLAKRYWLSPITGAEGLKVMDQDSLQHFLVRPETEQATHIALVDDLGREISRGFIVKPIWLERVKAVRDLR